MLGAKVSRGEATNAGNVTPEHNVESVEVEKAEEVEEVAAYQGPKR